MLECGEGHQSAVDVGRRRYSFFFVLCVSLLVLFMYGLAVWVAYISVVNDDERVGGVSGGYESNAHVVSLSLCCLLSALFSALSNCVSFSCCLSLSSLFSLPAVTVTD